MSTAYLERKGKGLGEIVGVRVDFINVAPTGASFIRLSAGKASLLYCRGRIEAPVVANRS